MSSVSDRSSQRASETGAAPQESSATSAWRSVILTILGQSESSIPQDELRTRSELERDPFDQTVHRLLNEGLIERKEAAYVLTDAGREVAAQERSRLLSF